MEKAKAKRNVGVDDGRLVYGVPEAGKLLGLTRNGSYQAARLGQIPTIKIGKLLKVPKVALHAMLEKVGA